MAIVDTPFGSFPLEWIFFVIASIAVSIILTAIFMSRRQPSDEPVTEAWEYEASGLCWPVPVLREDAGEIEYQVQYSKSMKPVSRIVKHSHPYNPAGTGQRVFMVPRGSTVADDPRKNFAEGQDQDEPEPLIQSAASFYNRLAAMMASAGLKLRENWFTILMIALAMFGVGVIVEAKFLLVPAVP